MKILADIVLVEFGRQKLWSVVISLHDEEPNNFDVKKIKNWPTTAGEIA